MENERTPLLAAASEAGSALRRQSTITFANSPAILKEVDFPEGDEDNPLEWSKGYKRGIIFLLAFLAFTTTFTCIGVVPIASQIITDLEGAPNKQYSVLLVTIWELGEAAGPLLIAPLSEVYGRYPVFNVANVCFIIGTLVAATGRSTMVLLLARFLTGCSVAANVLNPSIIGDMLPPEERGAAMSLIFFAPLIGGAVGPAIAGAVAQTLGWREVLFLAALIAAVCELAFFTLLRETYKPRILQQRVKRIRRFSTDTEALALVRTVTVQRESTKSAIWESLKRPAKVFFGSFVLQLLSLYGAFTFSMFYVMSTSLPDILHDVYKFPPSLSGASFLFFSIGSSFGILLCNFTLDRLYIHLAHKNSGIAQPEFRLPILVIGALIQPIVTIMYGFIAQEHWPVQVLLFALSLLGFSLLVAVVPMMAYVVDIFGEYSASAMTAILITRCLASTFLPLGTVALTQALGYGWGFLIIAGVLFAFAPLPILVMKYGAKWRQNCGYTRKLD